VIVTAGRVQPAQRPQLRQAASILAQKEIASLVLDSEQGLVRLGLGQELAFWLNAHYLRLDELRAETIAGRVKERLAKS
jgi:magnesium chelatase subunit D